MREVYGLLGGFGAFDLFLPASLRHRSLQYLTCSQTLAHFFRQAKGRLHCKQVFSGRFSFLWTIVKSTIQQ